MALRILNATPITREGGNGQMLSVDKMDLQTHAKALASDPQHVGFEYFDSRQEVPGGPIQTDRGPKCFFATALAGLPDYEVAAKLMRMKPGDALLDHSGRIALVDEAHSGLQLYLASLATGARNAVSD